MLIRDFISNYPEILTYTSLKEITFNGVKYANTNKLLTSYAYDGADGFKTGTIAAAGYCLSSTAVRDGKRVITVVMKASSNDTRHTDSVKLLNKGFSELESRKESLHSTIMNFSEMPEEIILNTDYKLNAIFTNVSKPYPALVEVRVNEELVSELKGTSISNQLVLPVNIYTEDDTLSNLDVELKLEVSSNETEIIKVTIPVNTTKKSIYRDINKHSAEEFIIKASNDKILFDSNDSFFNPNNPITRAEFITVLANIAKSSKVYLEVPFKTNFIDITEDLPYANSVSWAENNNLLLYLNDEFMTDSAITRAEVAIILNNYIDEFGINYTNENNEASVSFIDLEDMSAQEKIAIEKIADLGIMIGYLNDLFCPNTTVTRAEITSIAAKLYQVTAK